MSKHLDKPYVESVKGRPDTHGSPVPSSVQPSAQPRNPAGPPGCPAGTSYLTWLLLHCCLTNGISNLRVPHARLIAFTPLPTSSFPAPAPQGQSHPTHSAPYTAKLFWAQILKLQANLKSDHSSGITILRIKGNIPKAYQVPLCLSNLVSQLLALPCPLPGMPSPPLLGSVSVADLQSVSISMSIYCLVLPRNEVSRTGPVPHGDPGRHRPACRRMTAGTAF